MNNKRLKIFIFELLKIIGFITTFIGLLVFLGRFINLFPDARLGYHVIMALCGIITSLIFTRLIENRKFLSIGLSITEKTGLEIAYGFLITFGMISLIFLIEVMFGLIEIIPVEISLLSIFYNISNGLVIFTFVALNEEILFRGYMFQSLIKATNNMWALSITSVFFGFMHYFNPFFSIAALINIIFAGILFAVAYLKTGSLWMPITMHFTWNFFQGIIYAMPVSGIKTDSAFFLVREKGMNWLTGGSFGPEGGLLASVLLVIGIQLICSSKYLRTPRRI